jgi:hypothetical protein
MKTIKATTGARMEELAAGIYRWTTPHPEYRTSVERVGSYALVDGEMLALVDPLLPAEGNAAREAVLGRLDELVLRAPQVEIFVTIPYHARSAEPLYLRYASRLQTRIWGHERVLRRFRDDRTRLDVIPRGPVGSAIRVADGRALAFPIGRPRRTEYPIYFPGHRALAFGDAVVGTKEGLRVWSQSSAGPAWYHDVFAPTLRPLLDHDPERVLVTHGAPAMKDGRRALEEALAADPVTMY